VSAHFGAQTLIKSEIKVSLPYEDQEEVEKLKRWWKAYGNALLLGIVLGLAILFGNKYWHDYKRQQAEAASVLYDQMLEDYGKKAIDDARKAGSSLIERYPSTPYAGLAALVLARISFDAGKNEETRQRLQWAMEHAHDPGTRRIARLRLARVLAAAKEVDAALALLDVKDTSGFSSEYQELRGDLLASKGDKRGARDAYELALKELGALSPYGSVLQMKLDDLGPQAAQ
jgi:predicted negative regulator of RcsB-dependent stress response